FHVTGGQTCALPISLLVELVFVADEDPPFAEVANIGHKGCRVHRHQGVDSLAGGVDFLARKMNLKTAHPRLGPARGADLGREVRSEEHTSELQSREK